MRRKSSAASVVTFAALLVTSGRADVVDPTLPTRIVVGPPRGAAPMARIDAQRSGLARTSLPTKPGLVWRSRASAGVDFSVAVDEDGAIVVVSSAGVVAQLDTRGRTSWSRRTGSPPVTGPVLTSDGRRATLTRSGELVMFERSGRATLRRSLALGDVRGAASLLPLDDGGLAVAAGDMLVRVDRDGETLARGRIEGAVSGLLARGDEILAISERGLVFSFKAPRAPLRVGAFGGRVAESGTLDLPDRVLAVVDDRRLIELRLVSGVRRTLLADPVLRLVGPASLARDGGTRVLTTDGMLLAHDARGRELLRITLDPRAGTGESAGFAPPVSIDEFGRIAFAPPGRDAGVVLTTGEVVTAAGAACPDPIALSPAGKDRFVVACRSGVLLMIGQAQ